MFDLSIPDIGKKLFSNAEEIIDHFMDGEQVPCPVYHRFGPGIYIRELHMAAGTVAIGHIQKHEHVNVFIQGKVRVLNPDGSTTDISAPMTFVGKPGRKIGLVLEDMIWQNIYATDETDIEKLEKQFFEKPDYWETRSTRIHKDRSYPKLLAELGMTHEQVREEVDNEDDQIPMPYNWSNGVVRKSPIDGKGFFVTVPIGAGQIIAPTRVGKFRTPAGRYINHSDNPNAEMKEIDGTVYVVALQDFAGCVGGRDGDEVTVDYRQALRLTGRMEEKSCQE